jgi:predicted nucleic acid-binding Zn ribbon protein
MYRCAATLTSRRRGRTRTLITLLVVALDFVVYAVLIIGLTVAVYAPPAVV